MMFDSSLETVARRKKEMSDYGLNELLRSSAFSVAAPLRLELSSIWRKKGRIIMCLYSARV